MTISHNWLLEYIPASEIDIRDYLKPEKLSGILTSIGLEVESLHQTGSIPGGLAGLVAGEVVTCEKHPDADKLKLTSVNTGNEVLSIVCGADNVQAGQKVVVAPVGITIYPFGGGEIKLKKAKIRGVVSEGMICAEDEIGLSANHDGILVLPENTVIGTPVSEIFSTDEDYIYEIGLTPNRTDAMSHFGVARDVCAYLNHHLKKNIRPVYPTGNLLVDSTTSPVEVSVENTTACMRYSGISIDGITVKESPDWLKKRIQAVGGKPINNIVDITNFILHETGQPLHAFDSAAIKGNRIIVKNASAGSSFITLDEKERKLTGSELMICNESEYMCIAGVYGGVKSGVTEKTSGIFLESACFNPESIRKTSLAHGLRTEAAVRFEKGTDIGATVDVLKRAASLVLEIAGGKITGGITDIYPAKADRKKLELQYSYLKKLSGKNYEPSEVKNILTRLGFEIVTETESKLLVAVPSFKTDIHFQADLVEEVMRIDGLNNIPIPSSITISPSVEKLSGKQALKRKISEYLSASFFEIFTNSISNSQLYDADTLSHTVKMINSLSAELDILRPRMLDSGLASISYNINRKQADLRFFEFGKTYQRNTQSFIENEHLVLYITGNISETDWVHKPEKASLYYLKGVLHNLFEKAGILASFAPAANANFENCLQISAGDIPLGFCGLAPAASLNKHDIKQPVFYADIYWLKLLELKRNDQYTEISKFPIAERDLALVVDKKTAYSSIEKVAGKLKINNLTSMRLFDVFESDKLGHQKKSVAVKFLFSDDKKTLTDAEIDKMIQTLVNAFEKELNAEIRK